MARDVGEIVVLKDGGGIYKDAVGIIPDQRYFVDLMQVSDRRSSYKVPKKDYLIEILVKLEGKDFYLAPIVVNEEDIEDATEEQEMFFRLMTNKL